MKKETKVEEHVEPAKAEVKVEPVKAIEPTLAEKCDAAVKELGTGGDGIISANGKPVLEIRLRDGFYTFVAMKDCEKFGVVAGQVMIPSDQENIAAHAATCARDMA